MKCEATTKRGSPCTFDALPDKKLCGRHLRTDEATPKKDWREAFLEAFAKYGLVIAAAKEAGVARSTVYTERQRNEDFALKWAEIEEWTTEEMEQEARRRAVLGVQEPIYYKGDLVGHVRKYSDTLLIFMLKGRKPEVYRERYEVEHSGRVRTEGKVDLSKLTEEELREYRRLTEAASVSDD